MYQIKNFLDNDDIRVADKKGNIRIVEYMTDLSVNPYTCVTQYYAARMGVRKRQVLIQLQDDEYVTSAGAMQWTLGNVQSVTDAKGVGDFLGKAIKGAVTKESAIKPKYRGNGLLMLEPTYKHLLIEDLSNRILENRHSTYTIRIIVKLRLITFRMGIVNYPKWLYYIVRFLYKYGL